MSVLAACSGRARPHLPWARSTCLGAEPACAAARADNGAESAPLLTGPVYRLSTFRGSSFRAFVWNLTQACGCAQANVRTGGGEAMYDQRLFNQEGGLASGLEADDAYNTYDKPLFADRGSNLYRAPARGDDEPGADDEAGVRTEKFKPDRVRNPSAYKEWCKRDVAALPAGT